MSFNCMRAGEIDDPSVWDNRWIADSGVCVVGGQGGTTPAGMSAWRGESDSSCRTRKREFKLPWREAGPPNHHHAKVDSVE